MKDYKTLEYHRTKQVEIYHRNNPNAKYRKPSKHFVDPNKLNGKVCLICQSPLKGRQLKYCSTCRDLPHCFQCGKLKEFNHKLCKECREANLEKNSRESKSRMAEYRTTQEYRDWLNAQYSKPEFKERMIVNQRTYLATENGRLRSNWLHNRRHHELKGLPYISFEQYKQQIAIKKILPISVSVT